MLEGETSCDDRRLGRRRHPWSTDGAPQFDRFEEQRELTRITDVRPEAVLGPVGRRMCFVLIAMRRLPADEIGDYSGWSLPSGHRFSVDAPEDGIVGAHRVMGLVF
jgi:hypothetical protein